MRHRISFVSLVVVALVLTSCGGNNPLSLTPVSYNANAWQEAVATSPFTARGYATAVSYNGKIWIAGGEISSGVYTNDVWSSTDGISWTQATNKAAFSRRYGHSMVVYDNKMWVMCGHDGSQFLRDAYYSTDGENWTLANANAFPSGRSGIRFVVYNNMLWAIGCYTTSPQNTVYQSADGINWTLVTNIAFTSGGRYHTAVCVFKDAMWVIGGTLNGQLTNDVYRSTDGGTWTRMSTFAGASGRSFHGAFAGTEKMYYTSGQDSYGSETGTKQDVISSMDGITWSTVTSSAGYGARTGAVILVHNSKIWIIAGKSDGSTYLKNVWNTH
ncbi:MAG: kelch repeat-containing protein [Spirochaetota bacterium]